MTDASDGDRDFFVSFNQADRAWATWIAWVLEEKGYSVFFQDWDFTGNFVLKMDEAIKRSRRMVAVLSPDYLTSLFIAPEWAAVFGKDPTSADDLLVPVRVRECEPDGLLARIVYLDLTTSSRDQAHKLLLQRVSGKRLKPSEEPPFPISSVPLPPVSRSVEREPHFPGPLHTPPPHTPPPETASILAVWVANWRWLAMAPVVGILLLGGYAYFSYRQSIEQAPTSLPARTTKDDAAVDSKTAAAPLDDCDKLSAFQGNIREFLLRVEFKHLDAARAVPACEKAIARWPQEARFTAQYGRALTKAGKENEAVRWIRQAADQGYVPAQNYLGLMYANGRGGLARNEYEAVRWVRKAADQDYAPAQTNLGAIYLDGGGGLAEDETEAVRWIRKAANQGYARAQNYLGRMYVNGLTGVLAKDETEAVRWFGKAADQGYAPAQNYLGRMYENGAGGLARDETEAVRLYHQAADQGYAPAQSNLGSMYENGRGGLAEDETEAVRWYRQAADQGYAPAQNNLGWMYVDGRGGLAEDEAVRWIRQAADQGYADALDTLSRMYAAGLGGLDKDQTEATRLRQKAYDQRQDPAQNYLGVIYENSGGLADDEVIRWYHNSAGQNDVVAGDNLVRFGGPR